MSRRRAIKTRVINKTQVIASLIGKMLRGQTSNFYITTVHLASKHDHFVVNNQQRKTANSGQHQTVGMRKSDLR